MALTEARKAWKIKRRAAINELKLARGCADCGYNAHPAALQFDHPEGSDKPEYTKRHAYSLEMAWDRLLLIFETCDVVCANCHAIRTATRGYVGGMPMHRPKQDDATG
jgi:hypothetical protein